MKPTRNNSPETVLRHWRSRILNLFFGVVAVISLPAIGTIIASAASQPELWPIAIAFSFVELGLIALAVLRRLPINLRVGGLWLIGYIAAILNLSRTGLGGAGPLYLLIIPILILILAGKRASFFTAIFSGLLAIGCAILVEQGLLVPDLTVRSQGTSLTTIIMFLTVVMTILILFYRLQERLIDDERHVQADLLHARAMLEEQNFLLEQKIQERTGELQASNLSMEQRNAELALLNSVSTAMTKTLDVKALAHIVGDKIREIFDVDSALIMLLDRQTNLIHILFEYDKNEGGYIDYVEPFPLGTGLSSKVITSGQPLMANTLEEEVASGAYFPPEIIEKGSGFFSQSWLGVPIMAKDQVMGLVALADVRPYAFNENHLHLLQTLSSNVGAVLDNARLYTETERLLKETEQRNKELAIINKIQQALASKLDFQGIIDLFGNEIIHIFPPEQGNAQNYSALIALYDSQANLIHFPYLINGEGTRFVQPAMVLGLGLTSTVIQSGRPLVLKTVEEQIARGLVDYAEERIREKSQSWLGVPIRSGDRVMGVFSVEDPRLNLFTEADVRLLSTLAASLGVALENAHLFSETQRLLKETEQRNRELVIINNIQKGLASKLDLQSMIDLFGDELMKIFPPEERKAHNYSVFIALYDPQTKMIQFPYLIDGSGNRFIEPPTELGAGLTSVVIKSGQTLVLNTLEEQVAHGVILFTKSKVHIDSQSWVGVPIKNVEQVIGVVSMQDQRPNLFTESDIRLLNTLASNLEVALENARLFNETQQRAAELSTINTVSTALIRELDLGALINLVGEQIRSIFKADIVYVALLDTKKQLINFPYQFGEKHEPLVVGQGLTSKVIQTGKPLLINREMEQRRKELGTALVGKKTRSFLGVPVFVQGEAVGVISVQNTTQIDAFNEKDQHLLSTIAANVGIALQNARLFEEIKHQEQQAQEMQRRLADIINFLPDPTLVIDHEGKVIAWNRAIEEMTGVPAADMLGKGNHEYALPFYGERRPILIDLVLLPQEEVEKKYAQIKREGGILSGETYTPALKNGSRFLYGTASALHAAEGKIVGAIEIIRDITERIHAEEELRKAKAEAEQANHAKSAFLANMSHELRTPLNAIIGFTRIVRRKGENLLPEKQMENLDKVLTSADNLLSLINTVLDIAKIEAGRMDVLPANFRIGPLIDLCVNTAQPLLHPTVVLEKQLDEILTTIHSDQDKIRQIILNLLSNAAKFTHEGKITLIAEQNGENLNVRVTDTGIGISADALPNIFKEFEQADITTTRKYGGTGLGLAISRNLARLLGGDLTVQSEFGRGSTFTLVIPINYQRDLSQLEASTPPAPPPQPAFNPESTKHPGSDSAKKHILIIDDDPDAVYLLQENLDLQEFDIRGCQNGQDGLQMARQQHPHAILLDILMPGTDGWQVLHDLKNDPTTADIPVILHTIVDKKALGFQLGASDYLLKPLDSVAVRETLDRVIARNKHHPKQILLIDDDPNVADMLRQFLPESDFSLKFAPDGLAGLQSIETQRPDLLLLDLLMPNLDGFGVIERLRAKSQTRDLPIIVISAKELTAGETSHLKETVTTVMKKQGFEGEKLVEEINRVLRRDA